MNEGIIRQCLCVLVGVAVLQVATCGCGREDEAWQNRMTQGNEGRFAVWDATIVQVAGLDNTNAPVLICPPVARLKRASFKFEKNDLVVYMDGALLTRIDMTSNDTTRVLVVSESNPPEIVVGSIRMMPGIRAVRGHPSKRGE